MKHSVVLNHSAGMFKRVRVTNRDRLITGLFAAFATAHVISWIRFPWLAVTGRLSTSPVVVALCCVGLVAVSNRDWKLAKFVSATAVPVLAAGRFTFHILGGAPPFAEWNLFEVRCISELLVLVIIAVLCLTHPKDLTGRSVLITMLLGFLTDAYDIPTYSLAKVRSIQLLLCGMTIGFWFASGYYGGMLMLSAALLVPWAMLLSGERNNKNLVGVILVMKTIADLSDPSYLFTRELFVMIIFLDFAAALMAFLGRREAFSLVLMIQVMIVFASFILFICVTVDRSSPYFTRNAAAWAIELALYISYLMHGFGRGWSRDSLGSVLHSMFELEDENSDEDKTSAQTDEESEEYGSTDTIRDNDSCECAGTGVENEAGERAETSVESEEGECADNGGLDPDEDNVNKVLQGYRAGKAILYLAGVIIMAVSINSIAGTYVSSADLNSDRAENAESTETYLTWSDDRTIAAHYNLFKEVLYGPESELTYDKRLEFFKAAVDVESNYLCIPYAITVRTDKLNKGDTTKTDAHFNFASQTITVDEDYLAGAEPWDLMETAAHETFHAWQYEALLLNEKVTDERSRVFLYDQLSSAEEYKKEFTDYEKEGLDYYNQTVEKEARRYAADSVISVRERMIELAKAGE